MKKLNDKARTIFLGAVEIPSDNDQSAYVEKRCGGDAELRGDVAELLQHHRQIGQFLESPPAGVCVTLDQAPAGLSGTLIGPYKLLEQIGEGGMGLVYMAEQQRPMRRLVALKLIKPGMDTKQVIARFEVEKQALAMMDHENIAKVFEAGATESGRFYFAMELVRGIPINEFCEQKRLSVRERLKLFMQVCQAVQHAHQKGIIHRDLKPSNVLVTLHDVLAVPKVIDFGIAKALGQQLTEHTLHTGFAQLVGTPLYMSPEQAEMNQLGVDTRSDVYSLGVLLYELLTGTTPFDQERLKSVGFDEMRRIIREEEPETVSNRLARTRTDKSGVDAGVNRRVHAAISELDWIVMKSLEKDRSRRYESASALAADIQRYLSDEPVLACPPTTMYRFQKFVRKHKASLTTATALAACLILGTTVSAWQAVRATTAEAQANANEQKAKTERDEVKSLYDRLQATQADLRRTLYAAHMNLAKNAWDEAAVTRVEELLGQHRPKAGDADLRGFEWHYLNRLCNSQLLTLRGHTDTVNSVAYSPDGTRLATTSRDQTIKVWDAKTGQTMLTISGHALGKISSGIRVAFGANGKRLASVTSQGMKVWDAQSGQEIVSIDGVFDAIAYSRDGEFLASGGYSGEQGNRKHEVKLWDAETGKQYLTLSGELDFLNAIAFSPDSRSLVATDEGSILKIWDVQSGKELRSFKGSYWSSVAFSEDGKRLVAGGNKVQVWDLQTGQEIRSFNESWSESVAFSPDGRRIATGFLELQIWDADTGKLIRSLKGAGTVATYSPDGQRLASAVGNVIKLWDVNKDQENISIKIESPRSVAFSPDWRLIADAYSDDTVKVRDVASEQELLSLKGHTVPIRCVVFSRDGKRLATGGGGRRSPGGGFSIGTRNRAEIKVWDAETGRELFTLPPLVGSVQSMAFSPDCKRLASAAAAPDNPRPGEVVGEIKLWDAATGSELLAIKGHSGFVQSVVFSPDGSRLASYGGGEVMVWDAQTGQKMLSINRSVGAGRVAFSPDGKQVASSGGGRVQVWDAQTGKEIFDLYTGETHYLNSVAFSPDGKRLACPAVDTTIKIWDARTGEEMLTLRDNGTVARVEFSPDSSRLASASLDGTVKICDATPLPEKP